MAVSFSVVEYSSFGKCLKIENDLQEMYVTIDIGPRVIKYNLKGLPNVMKEDSERSISRSNDEIDAKFGKGSVWYIYGGHRFWVSPENMPDSYYPDNDAVDYEISGSSVLFTPPVQRATGFCLKLRITMSQTTAEAEVEHILEYHGSGKVNASVWALSVMAPGGTAFARQCDDQTGLLPNRYITLWPYSNPTDSRFCLGEKYISLTSVEGADCPFKVGFNNTHGTIVYVNNGCAFKKEFDTFHGKMPYPDGDCSTELYTNDAFLEAESLGALTVIESGKSTSHTERWSLSTDTEIDF